MNRRIARGEIYYIKSFPTTGHEQRSGRPAVIVSNNENNANSGVFEICYLTLKEKKDLPTHIFIDRGHCINSTILCEQITSVSEDKVGDYVCKVPDDIMERVDKALAVSLGITHGTKFHPDSLEAELTSLKYHNKKISEELALAKDANEVIKKNAAEAISRADMYERMYNDLLDRVMNRGK